MAKLPSDATNLDELEEETAQQLRSLCNQKGIEIEPHKTGKLLHQLGLIYHGRSPNKLSLIQACGLLNAALIRCPEQVKEIKRDLAALCSHVLSLAKAVEADADLVAVAKDLHKSVKEMRQDAFAALKMATLFPNTTKTQEENRSKKVKYIKELQMNITSDYTALMQSISARTVQILGKPPCSYSHIGLGSLARNEVTPFSDFESIIVLEDRVERSISYLNVLEYFRWYTVIFQLVMLNFGETIVPSIAVPSLNNDLKKGGNWFFDVHTPRGICFDGLMPHASKNPLGRQTMTPDKPFKIELIKPVSQMIKYLSSNEDLKNGYHLAEMLTTTCYVAGDKTLYNTFQDMVLDYENCNHKKFLSETHFHQLQDDLDAYSVFSSLATAHGAKALRTKQMLYRSSTLFVVYLGKLHQCKSISSFGIISELEEGGIISSQAASNLSYAVAIACEARLKTYMNRKAQSDTISLEQILQRQNTGLEQFISIADLVAYFKITFSLQLTIKLGPKNRYEVDFQTVGKEVEAGILFYLLQYKDSLKKAKEFRESFLLEDKQEKVMHCTSFIKECLFRLKRYTEALEESRNDLSQQLQAQKPNDQAIVDCTKAVARCLFQTGRYIESAYEHQRELKRREGLSKEARSRGEELKCVHNIACAYFKSESYDRALEWFIREKLEYEAETEVEKEGVEKLFECYTNIAGCQFKQGKFEGAISYYTSAIEVVETMSVDDIQRHIEDIADCRRNIGYCYYKKQMYEKALSSYEKELEILKSDSSSSDSQSKIFDCQSNLAGCYYNLKMFAKALEFYKQVLGSQNTNPNYDFTLKSVEECLLQLNK